MNDLSLVWLVDRRCRLLPPRLRRALRKVVVVTWCVWSQGLRDPVRSLFWKLTHLRLWLQCRYCVRLARSGMDTESAVAAAKAYDPLAKMRVFFALQRDKLPLRSDDVVAVKMGKPE